MPLKQVAITSLDNIVEKFGKGDPGIVLEAAWAVSSDKCIQAVESSLRTASLLCLATMIEVSEEAIVPMVPLAFAKCVENLGSSISEDTEDASLHNAAYSFMVALLLYVPWMITGSNLDQLLTISHESANAQMGEECDEIRTEALRLIPKQVEAKDCFAALDRTWTSAMTEGPIVSLAESQMYSEHLLTGFRLLRSISRSFALQSSASQIPWSPSNPKRSEVYSSRRSICGEFNFPLARMIAIALTRSRRWKRRSMNVQLS